MVIQDNPGGFNKDGTRKRMKRWICPMASREPLQHDGKAIND